MENQFYHISWPPLNVTIFIAHVRNLRNGSYANGILQNMKPVMYKTWNLWYFTDCMQLYT